MQRKPLVELDAEQNIVQARQVVDIQVSDGRVEYLKNDSWYSIPLREAPECELDIAYQSLEDDYRMLQKVVSKAYDREKEMWELEYTTDVDGVMKSLYIRLDSPFTENITVYNLHDENGNPKRSLRTMPYDSSKLETKELYADSLDNPTIHTDVEITYDIPELSIPTVYYSGLIILLGVSLSISYNYWLGQIDYITGTIASILLLSFLLSARPPKNPITIYGRLRKNILEQYPNGVSIFYYLLLIPVITELYHFIKDIDRSVDSTELIQTKH